MNYADDLVLQIIGKESPAICGISGNEMWDDSISERVSEMRNEEDITSAPTECPPTRPLKRKFDEKQKLEMDFYRLRNENLRLQNELLKLKIRKYDQSEQLEAACPSHITFSRCIVQYIGPITFFMTNT